MNVSLVEAKESEKEQFITNIQAAFKKAFVDEFGETEGEIIPREDVIKSFNAEGAVTYNIIHENKIVGGVVVVINNDTNHNELSLFFVNNDCHSKGIGCAAWQMIESLYPKTKVWETFTPYFDKRNIHFYVNKCGFHIVEFYNPHHVEKNHDKVDMSNPVNEYHFRFEKVMVNQ